MALSWNAYMGEWRIFPGPIAMCGPGWKPLDLEQLWPMPQIRGENEELPGVDGMLPREMFIDQVVRDVHFQMDPECDQDGDPHPSRAIGARRNMEVIEGIADGTLRQSELIVPDSPTYQILEADIQLRCTPPARDRGLIIFTLTVTIPAGLYTPQVV